MTGKSKHAGRGKYVGVALCLLGGLAVGYYATDLVDVLKNRFYGAEVHSAAEHKLRNIGLMEKHGGCVYGIDISQYQGKIDWTEMNSIHDRFPMDFVFIRATMGTTGKDERFAENWKAAGSRAKLRGAYHYFRPNENSLKQARNFIETVHLKPGDLPPVLDIEERPKRQSMDSLAIGLKRWLATVGKHYGVPPILYSGDSYFTDFLEKEFSGHVLWIANYNFWVGKPKKHWDFWQFSDNGFVRGIEGPVDINMFQGSIEELEQLAVRY